MSQESKESQESQEVDDSQQVSLLKNPLELALCGLLVAIVSLTFIQVVSRYVIGASLAWSEELALYLFLWLAVLASAYAFKTGSHFALRFMVDALGTKMQKAVSYLALLIVCTFLIIFTWKAAGYTYSMRGQTGPGTGFSMAVPYSSLVVGGILMLYYAITSSLKEIRQLGQQECDSKR